MGEIEWELTTGKKCAVMKQLFVALQKKKKTLLKYYFNLHTFSLFSRLLSGLENCWANFKTFSRIQDSVSTLGLV